MGLLHRRSPWYGRPLPFTVGFAVAFLGLFLGVGWRWQWSLQTGNVFLLLTFPKTIVPLDLLHVSLLGLGVGGSLIATSAGLRNESQTRALLAAGEWGWRRPSFRFYPLTLLFGLFLAYFGATFLFDASVYGDTPPQGFAAFLYFDYAGLLDRPVMTGVGVLVLAVGVTCATSLAFERGHGLGATLLRPATPFAAVEPTRDAPMAPVPSAMPRPFSAAPRDVTPRASERSPTAIPRGVRARSTHEDLQQVRLREDPERFARLGDEHRGRVL